MVGSEQCNNKCDMTKIVVVCAADTSTEIGMLITHVLIKYATHKPSKQITPEMLEGKQRQNHTCKWQWQR